ncbi:MAG: M23 family metallopeptidase [Brevinematia bacterium]
MICISILIFLLYICSCSFSEVINISKLELSSPGEVIILSVDSSDYRSFYAKVSYNDELRFPFYPYSNKSVSIVPVPIQVSSQEVKVEVLKNGRLVFSNYVKLSYLDYLKKEKPKMVKLTKKSKNILSNTETILKDINYIYTKITNIDFYGFYNTNFGGFMLPSTNSITSRFGVSRRYPNKIRYHNGVDFSADPDDNVYCVSDGIVVLSSNFLANGETIYIYHGYGIISSYFHLDKRFVNENDFVKKGQVIGKMGQTGIVTGPHLHLGMYVLGVNGYIPIDPLKFVSLDGQNKVFVINLLGSGSAFD